jgi:hypothetical protein
VQLIFTQLAKSKFICYLTWIEIYEKEKSNSDGQPEKKIRGRGAVRADGIEDFNPDSNIKLTRNTEKAA